MMLIVFIQVAALVVTTVVAYVVYKWIKPTDFIQYISAIVLAVVAILTFNISFYQTDQNLQRILINGNRQFNLTNRPFIEITKPLMGISGRFFRNKNPEIVFQLQVGILNHGRLPGRIKSVDRIIQSSTDENKFSLLMPAPKDKERQWSNLDVFPFIPQISEEKGLSSTAYLSISDAAITLDTDDVVFKEITQKKSEFWDRDGKKIGEDLLGKMKEFHLVLQMEYYALSDDYKHAQPYCYSVRFKYVPQLNKFAFVESLAGNNGEEAKWFLIGGDGRIIPFKQAHYSNISREAGDLFERPEAMAGIPNDDLQKPETFSIFSIIYFITSLLICLYQSFVMPILGVGGFEEYKKYPLFDKIRKFIEQFISSVAGFALFYYLLKKGMFGIVNQQYKLIDVADVFILVIALLGMSGFLSYAIYRLAGDIGNILKRK